MPRVFIFFESTRLKGDAVLRMKSRSPFVCRLNGYEKNKTDFPAVLLIIFAKYFKLFHSAIQKNKSIVLPCRLIFI